MKKLALHWAVLLVTLMTGASSVTKRAIQVQKPTGSFKTLHTFGGGTDGAYPVASLIRDRSGNLYGTTLFGGANGDGTVFEVSYSKGGWKETVIYSFGGGADGIEPWGSLTFDKTGHLYGTTMNGGINGYGTVFELSHKKSGWEETVIYTFSWKDGANPIAGVVFDKSGNLIGTTALGGSSGFGTVFELTLSGGKWTQTILHNFAGYPNDGTAPNSLLTSDNLGNLYGTTEYGGSSGQCGSSWGSGCGTAFELTPSSGGWSETVLQNFCFCPEGMQPLGLLLFRGSFLGTSGGEELMGMATYSS